MSIGVNDIMSFKGELMKKVLNLLLLLCLSFGTKVVADEVVVDQMQEPDVVVSEQVEPTETVTGQAGQEDVVMQQDAMFTGWAQACQEHPYITGGAVGGSSLLVAALIYALKYYLWNQAQVEIEVAKQAAKRDDVAVEGEELAVEGDEQVAVDGQEAPFYQPCIDHPYITGGTTAGVTALIAAIVYLLKQYLAEQVEDATEEEIKMRMQGGCGCEAAGCDCLQDGRCECPKDDQGNCGCTKTRAKKAAEKLKRAFGVSDVQDCPFLGLCVELMGAFGDECPYLKEHPEELEKRDAKKCPFLAACKK